MKIKILVIMLASYSVIALCGCAAISGTDRAPTNPALLEPQAVLKFSDVPVPVGFKLIPQDSYSFEASNVRVGLLKYQGKGNIEQVVNFFKEQMVMYNWDLLNAVEYGQRLLNFNRESETCIISLLPKGNNIDITVAIGPKSQQQLSKKTKPVK